MKKITLISALLILTFVFGSLNAQKPKIVVLNGTTVLGWGGSDVEFKKAFDTNLYDVYFKSTSGSAWPSTVANVEDLKTSIITGLSNYDSQNNLVSTTETISWSDISMIFIHSDANTGNAKFTLYSRELVGTIPILNLRPDLYTTATSRWAWVTSVSAIGSYQADIDATYSSHPIFNGLLLTHFAAL